MNLKIDEATYHIKIVGNGEPLLLLHGFTGNSTTWNEVLGTLSSKYMCIMPDLLGHGKSSSPNDSLRYSIEATSLDLCKILQELQLNKAHVLGYSMGGRLALSFALQHNEYVKSLILESASPGLKTNKERIARQEQDSKLAKMILENGMTHFVNYWQNIPLFETQKNLPKSKRFLIYNQRMSNDAKGLANSLLGMGTGFQKSYWDCLNTFQKPVLLLTGECDKKFCNIADEMNRRFKTCEWRIVPETGHAIHVEESEMFGRIVSEFVEKWRGL